MCVSTENLGVKFCFKKFLHRPGCVRCQAFLACAFMMGAALDAGKALAQTSCHVVCRWTAAPRASVAVLPSTRIPGWDLSKEFAIVNYINWILISIASKFTESNLVENKSSSYSQFSLDHTTCCRSSQHRSSALSPTPGAWWCFTSLKLH